MKTNDEIVEEVLEDIPVMSMLGDVIRKALKLQKEEILKEIDKLFYVKGHSQPIVSVNAVLELKEILKHG